MEKKLMARISRALEIDEGSLESFFTGVIWIILEAASVRQFHFKGCPQENGLGHVLYLPL
jgi:hypothetical protein